MIMNSTASRRLEPCRTTKNAALIYQRLTVEFNDSNAPSFFNDGNSPSTCVQWKGIEHPETAAFIDAHQNIVTEVMVASNMDKCIFPLRRNPMDMPIPMLGRTRHIASLLLSSANRDMGEYRIDEALEKYKCLVRMGRHIQSQPSFMLLMEGDVIERMAYTQLSSLVIDSNLSRTQRDSIHQTIPATIIDDWSQLQSPILETEKLFSKNTMAMILYEINDDGTVRFRRGNVPFDSNASNIQRPHRALQIKMQKLGSVILWFIIPCDPKVLSRIYDEEFQRAGQVADANKLENKQPLNTGYFLAWLRDPHRSTARFIVQRSISTYEEVHRVSHPPLVAYRRGMVILLAMRDYKDANSRWPNTLDEIKTALPAEAVIDPFTQHLFIYKVKDDRFLLYSVGPNKIDDRGKPKPSCRDGSCKTDHSGSDDILIWPPTWKEAQKMYN